MKQDRIHKFVGDQLSQWPLACGNFRALKDVSVREIEIGGLTVKLQFNPARIVSSAAKTSKEELAKRKCFLCRENRPAEQIMIKFEGRKGKKYDILVNPYPIFPDHLVIAKSKHTDQSIWHRYIDMLDLSKKYSGYTFFYNGPKCGASAPDHHHFQGAPKGLMPLENDVNASVDNAEILEYITSVQDASLYHYKKFTSGVFFLRAETSKSAAKLFYRLLDCADILEGDIEPRINLFSWWQDGEYRSIVVFRRSHRSHHYFSEGPDHLTMSPGCADMGGVFIVPVPEEYEKMTPELLAELVEEVSVPKSEEAEIIERLTRTQKNINIGIMSAEELTFEILSDGAGVRKAVARDGKIEYDGALYDELYFDAPTLSTMFAEPSFVLHDVTIGVDFHWERKEVQKFAGALKIIVADGKLVAINVVGIEDYLLSVISSEMSATADEEFLKAHAVISRSWVMAQLSSARQARNAEIVKKNSAQDVSESPVVEYVKWYDKDDHDLFDVCADDHCQRYQGLTRAIGNKVRKVIDATWGQVLKSDGKLCDARFSKCCGGRMEKFSVCWEDKDYDYLQPLPDTPGHIEGERAFCDTSDPVILAKVLNNYDQETVDFYRWTETYDRNAISALIKERSGISLGVLNAVKPIERGVSGRIYRLALVGSERTLVIGKELEIRRTLSKTHLKSSAFEVEYLSADGMVVSSDEDWTVLRLLGSGWGHGVGLCQIGAAVMAVEGYDYTQILEHYYPGSDLEKE
jgi:SpoIID/LytB domain protein